MIKVSVKDNNIILEDVIDFALEETLDCGQAFRWVKQPDNSFVGVVTDKICHISKKDNTITLHNISLEDYNNFWKEYFDLDRDYSAIKAIAVKDEALAKAVGFAPGIRVLKQDSWEALCSFIVSQNNNIKRIKGIIERLCSEFGQDLGDGHYSFPTAEKLATLTVEDLAPLRSGFRARYIIDAATKVASGEIDLGYVNSLPLEEARKELTKIVGVGVKVADCALLFGFGRVDCFPVDVWIKRAMAELFPQGLPQECMPYAGIVQQYIFHYARVCPEAFASVEK